MPQVPRASRNFAPFIGSINPNKVVPDLVPLLVLVLLGELFGTLEDVGALGFASNLCSENLRHSIKILHIEHYLGLDSLLGPEGAVLRLPLPPLQDCLRHCRQFAFHSHSGF